MNPKRTAYLLTAALALFGLGVLTGKGELVRLDKPRVAPVEKSEWTDAQRAYLEPYEQSGRLYNVFKTFARHPELASRFSTFGGYILRESTLSPRHREMAILRIGWLCQSEYEWGQHRRLGLEAGLTEEEILRINEGPGANGWSPFEAALLRAVDELHSDAFITDATWDALTKEYDEKNMMDLVFTVGDYNMVSMALNSFGVQLDEGLTGFPK
jgi:alkylhydroperoxidase family enzyme